jgi:dTMP kinase
MAHNTQNTRGRFITFEGGEGVGKSTQIKHLASRLSTAGASPLLTREPGGSHFAERMRAVLLDPKAAPKTALAQSLLFFAARSDHLDETIRPALTAARWVLCDRFADSTRAYQGAASGVPPAAIAALNQLVVGTDQPDLTILLDLDPKIGLARADQRRAATPGAFVAADTYESRRLDFHQRLREGFLEIARQEPNRVVVVDAFRNELMIADEIWHHVSSRFGVPPSPPVAGA